MSENIVILGLTKLCFLATTIHSIILLIKEFKKPNKK